MITNTLQVKTLLQLLIDDHLGIAHHKILKRDFPAIFVGNPNFDQWEFSGVLCIIDPIEQNEPVKLTEGFYQNFDWRILFRDFSTDTKKLPEIWEVLRYKFRSISHLFIDSNSRVNSQSTLIVNIPSQAFYF